MKDNFEELRLHIKDDYIEFAKTTTHQVLDYCRAMQKQHVESLDTNTISGVEVLASMLQNGSITLKMFVNMLPAVQNYTVRYTLTINIDEEDDLSDTAHLTCNYCAADVELCKCKKDEEE